MNNRAAIFVFNAFLVVFPATLLFAQKPDHVSGHLLAQRTRRASAAAAGQAYARHGAKVISTIPQLNIDVLSLPEEAANGVAHSLGSSGLFNFVEKNGLARGSSVIPNDPSFPSQWHLTTINAPNAWSMTTGSSSVVIAMVDSGVNPTHPDLAARLVPGYSFLTSSTNTADVQGHGTATAGTAAAASNNGVGVAGVSWQNPIMPLVVLDSTDYATYSNIASAITYAADHGARVINISIGGSTPSSTLQSAVNYAWNKGSVVFASAMNSAGSAPYYPAACDNVVAVSATEPNDTLAAFSNYGSWIDLSAPGDSILTTDNSGGYSTWAGTSFSSPIAAATAALALTINPSLSAQALVNLLEQNSDDLGTPGWDQYFGFGRINAYRVTTAANQSISTDTIAPSVTILSPGSGATVSGVVAITGTATDNIGVVTVQLWIDGVLDSTCASLSFSCSWNTAGYGVGNHTVTVKAVDAAGNTGSASTTLTLLGASTLDTTPPTVAINSPANGAVVSGTVTINASASDNVGVSQVGIFIDGTLKATLTVAPYSYNWNTRKTAAGSHTITAKAWDAAGNTATTSITVRK